MIRLEDARTKAFRYALRYRIPVGIVLLICILVGMVITFFLTKEEAPQVSSRFVIEENYGYQSTGMNPLKSSTYEEINTVVRDYYKRLAQNSKYAENYEDVEIYTKLGRYEGTYIVFAVYNMAIPDIYTRVPGLDTFYVYRDSGDMLRISDTIYTDEIVTLIKDTVAHEDVQAIMADVQQQYQAAVESDAMLRESLADLQQASKVKD